MQTEETETRKLLKITFHTKDNKSFYICNHQSNSDVVDISPHDFHFIPSEDNTEPPFNGLLWRVLTLSLTQENEWHFARHPFFMAVLQ
jgi:hypothetical protein